MKRRLSMVLGLLIAITVGYFIVQTWIPSSDDSESIVHIAEGATFDEIVSELDAAGLIRSRTAFRILATSTGKDSRIKPGTYRFSRGVSASQLLDALVEGRSTIRVKVTFPEGSTIRRIASILSRSAGVDSARFVRLATDRTFLATQGIEAATAEGYLMPDTYFVYWGEQPRAVITKMIELHSTFYNDGRKKEAEKVGLSPYQALVLASIVEGEARVEEERAIVAGVYLNRLRRGMKLQADPTLQYVIPDGPRRLLNADLQLDSPYNTYRYPGLPPTPINNPGRASIDAVLHPERNDYLYFVARADGSGQHTFSRNGAEHAQAVNDYRERVRRQRRESGQ